MLVAVVVDLSLVVVDLSLVIADPSAVLFHPLLTNTETSQY